MKVLVWKSFGCINVYAATEESFTKVKEQVIQILISWGPSCEKDVLDVEEFDTFGLLVNYINANHMWCDSFENFCLVEVKE